MASYHLACIASVCCIVITASACRFNIQPGSSVDFSSGGLARENAENPLLTGKPLVKTSMSPAISCGGHAVEADSVRVAATERQLCVTKTENVSRSAANDADVRPRSQGLEWKLTSGSKESDAFSLSPQGAPTDRGFCTETAYAHPEERNDPRVQADAYGRLVKTVPVRVTQYVLEACVPNRDLLTATSNELALRLRATGASSFADWGAWGFSQPGPAAR